MASRLPRNKISSILADELALLPIANIKRNGGTQPRDQLDTDAVDEYHEKMSVRPGDSHVVDLKGEAFPPVRVKYDGTNYWLYDGFHRIKAATKAKISKFQAVVEQGTQRDAVRASLGVNDAHGLRRTRKDKKKAVWRAFQDEEWWQYTDKALAEMCGVSRSFIASERKEYTRVSGQSQPTTRITASGQKVDVSQQVGKRDKKVVPIEVEAVVRTKDGRRVTQTVSKEEAEKIAVESDNLYSLVAHSQWDAILADEKDLAAICTMGSNLKEDNVKMLQKAEYSLKQGGALMLAMTPHMSAQLTNRINSTKLLPVYTIPWVWESGSATGMVVWVFTKGVIEFQPPLYVRTPASIDGVADAWEGLLKPLELEGPVFDPWPSKGGILIAATRLSRRSIGVAGTTKKAKAAIDVLDRKVGK